MVEFCYSQIRGVPSMAFRNGIVTRLLQGVMDGRMGVGKKDTKSSSMYRSNC